MRPNEQEALSTDIRRLGDLLGQALRRVAGETAFELVEEIRAAAKNLRANPTVEQARQLRDRLAVLPLADLRTLTTSASSRNLTPSTTSLACACRKTLVNASRTPSAS